VDDLEHPGRLGGHVERGLIKHVMEQPVIGPDQTSWPRLDGAGTKPWQK
jgi:hypothetical protein